jgi:hypothetical protein
LLSPTIRAFHIKTESNDCHEKESIIVVSRPRVEPFRPALEFSPCGSLLLVAEPPPLAVLVDDLLEKDRYLRGGGLAFHPVQV